jgi:hypothetical protein
LIPILNHLLEQKDSISSDNSKKDNSSAIQAVIMTPTRELATQIHSECDKLLPNQCVTLVGGIALVKQIRLLKTKKPSIVVATPGRLWAMVSCCSQCHNIFFILEKSRKTTSLRRSGRCFVDFAMTETFILLYLHVSQRLIAVRWNFSLIVN